MIVNKRGNPCPKCLPFCGKVLIDDVWSGGKKSDGPYPLMSTAIEYGLYHPRCRDSHTTYFPGSPRRMIPGRGKNWKALRKRTCVKDGCSMLPDRPESMPDWRNFLWIWKTGKNTHGEQENGTRRPRRGSGVMKNCQII